jgi:hypothetical protein
MSIEKALTSITLAKQNLETLIGAAAKTFPTIYAVNIATHLDVAEHELAAELGTRNIAEKPDEKPDEKAFATNARVGNILDVPISHIEELPASMDYARRIVHAVHDLAQLAARQNAGPSFDRDARLAAGAAELFQQARRDVLMDLYMGILRDGVLRDDPMDFHSPLASPEATAFRLGAYLIDAARKNEVL